MLCGGGCSGAELLKTLIELYLIVKATLTHATNKYINKYSTIDLNPAT